jgi:chromatin segregation and condensation protein Rec8/ScpA/Scc1 (kleisin family)
VVGTFLAVLQLARDGELRIEQDADLQDLKLISPAAA